MCHERKKLTTTGFLGAVVRGCGGGDTSPSSSNISLDCVSASLLTGRDGDEGEDGVACLSIPKGVGCGLVIVVTVGCVGVVVVDADDVDVDASVATASVGVAGCAVVTAAGELRGEELSAVGGERILLTGDS